MHNIDGVSECDMSEINKKDRKTYLIIGALVAVALAAGIITTVTMNAKAVSLKQKEITITNDNMPKTPEIEMQAFKLENNQEVQAPEGTGRYFVKAGSDSLFRIHLVSHDARDFNPQLRVYNANNATAEGAAFARVASTGADKGFPPGLTASLLPGDHLPLAANAQVPVVLVVHTTPELKAGTYQIAVALQVDQDIQGEPLISHVQGKIITIEVS